MKSIIHLAFVKSLVLPLAVLLLSVLPASSSSAQILKPERKLIDKTSKEVPVKIHAVRNLQKPEEDEWFRDLEIEVKNVSDKPIYFISLSILFPEINAPPPAARQDGITPARTVTGFPLHFGNPKLGVLRNLAGPDDEFLKPGETYTFKIPEGYWMGFKRMKKKRNLSSEVTGYLEVVINTVGFGDGTGYVAGRKIDKRNNIAPTK